jgi:deoxyhypusine synthase
MDAKAVALRGHRRIDINRRFARITIDRGRVMAKMRPNGGAEFSRRQPDRRLRTTAEEPGERRSLVKQANAKGKAKMNQKPKLEALRPLNVDKCKGAGELLDAMLYSGFGGRELGRAWQILKRIAENPDWGVVLTVSGALTIAKMGQIFAALISRSIVDAVVTTGAVVTHSLVEELGMTHYKVPTNISDEELCKLALNRIYDSIEPEANLRKVEELVRKVFAGLTTAESHASFELVREISAKLLTGKNTQGWLAEAARRRVNVYVPALSDSELGLYLYRYDDVGRADQDKIVYDALRDLKEYERWMCSHKQVAFISLGGGVPRNWCQQMLPYLRTQRERGELSPTAKLPKIAAGVRICPDSVTLGHLSGCTYSEGVSWGKLDGAESQRNFVCVHCDATTVFPFLAKALIDYADQTRNSTKGAYSIK